jgi:Tfp pilus assembly protein PilN
MQNTSAEIASIQSQLDTTDHVLQQKLAGKQKLTGKITELEKKIAEAETSGVNFAAVLAYLEKQSNQINDNLEVTVNSLPASVSLSSISHSNPTLSIKGRAPSEEEILSYLRELEASGKFSNITITSLRRVSNQRMDFTLILSAGE